MNKNYDGILKDPTVHDFTNQIIIESYRHDTVDAIADIELALKGVKARFDRTYTSENNNQPPNLRL